MSGFGFGGGCFSFILVLFILLVIIICSGSFGSCFDGGFGKGEHGKGY